MKPKKIFLRLLFILIVLLISFFLWLLFPSKGIEITRLIPQQTFTFLTLKIDLKDSGTSKLINNFNWRIRWGMRLLGPAEIAALATPSTNKEEPDYLFLVKNGRLIKVARLFRRLIDRAMTDGEPFARINYKSCRFLYLKGPGRENEVSTYTLFKDIALFSNNPSLLRSSLDQYEKERSFIPHEALKDFPGLQGFGVATLLITNSHSELSRAMKSLEKKSAYTILPTVDSIDYLEGFLNILNADSLKGSLFFKYRERGDIRKAEEDIRFLAEFLRPLCEANRLSLEEEIIIEGEDRLNLNFKISGLKSFIAGLLEEKEKEEIPEVKGKETEVSSPGILKKRKRPEYLAQSILTFLLAIVILSLVIIKKRKRKER